MSDAFEERVIEMLREGSTSARRIAITLKCGQSRVARVVNRLIGAGLLERRGQGAQIELHLVGDGAQMSLPAAPPTQPKGAGDRVSLAEELLEIERVMGEAVKRRAEILEALR